MRSPLRTDWQHVAEGKRNRVLLATGRVGHAVLTQTNESREQAGRFTLTRCIFQGV